MAGSNHITYGEPALIRLTTDAPLSYIEEETAFALTRPLHLVFGPDEPFAGEPAATVRDFLQRTNDYWREWVRRLSIAYEWQEATIRAAITLKLSNFEETGGIVAALTTSLPEAAAFRPQLGLPLLLAEGRLFRGQGAEPHRRHPHDGGLHRLYPVSIAGEDDTLKPCLRHRAQRRSDRMDRARSQGLRGPWPGAHRQCRGDPDPA